MASTGPSSLSRDATTAVSRLLQNFDTSATRLSAILSTSTGVDKFLLTIYYTLKFLYPQIARVRALRLRSQVSEVLKTASPALIPGEAVIAVQRLGRTDQALAATDVSLRNLAALVSEFRMISRLWGLLTMYRWARGTWNAPPPGTRVDAAIVWGQIGACTVYQALENVAFLAGKGVLRGDWVSPERQATMWVVSCRFWFAHTVLEAWRLVRESRRTKMENRLNATGEKEAKIQARQQKKAWYRAWWTNAGYAPMALHYSLANGLISDDTLGALGLVVAYNSFGHMWRETART